MEFYKSNYHQLATICFVLFIALAHIFSTNHYDWTRNTISDLGAQAYSRKLIMQIGFISFGLLLSGGIFLNGFSWRTSPILIYGLSIAFTGVFCTKPFFNFDHYSTLASSLHSGFAQLAGLSFSVGILVQLFYSSNNNLKYMHLLFFVLVIGLSVTFGVIKNYQGIVQRLLYLASFIWLLKYYKP